MLWLTRQHEERRQYYQNRLRHPDSVDHSTRTYLNVNNFQTYLFKKKEKKNPLKFQVTIPQSNCHEYAASRPNEKPLRPATSMFLTIPLVFLDTRLKSPNVPRLQNICKRAFIPLVPPVAFPLDNKMASSGGGLVVFLVITSSLFFFVCDVTSARVKSAAPRMGGFITNKPHVILY